MSFERLLELLRVGTYARSADQELEFDTLRGQRRFEQLALIPRPTCCEAIQKYPVITFEVSDGPDSSLADGRWGFRLPPEFWDHFGTGGLIKYIQDMPEPEYCPFCSSTLPKMIRKDPPPPHLCRITDGGFYCDTCLERLDGCICDPPTSAFEPCIDPPLKTIPTNTQPELESEPNEP
jgi:hypothetical protein